jgi:protocatechuate 3,4-dioxygenase beta subunit
MLTRAPELGENARQAMDPATFNCTLTPETDEGPYWVDERLNRADIVAGQPGVPLTVDISVCEMNASLLAYEGAVVDIWHANAMGLYSDEPNQPGGDTSGETFLRGYQVTDASGVVEFQTIYPGWYEGRTIHIHVRGRTFAKEEATFSFTAQIFFDEATNEAVLAASPYDQRLGRDTTNAGDDIFLPDLISKVEGDPTEGYRAAFGIRLHGLPAQEAEASVDHSRVTEKTVIGIAKRSWIRSSKPCSCHPACSPERSAISK